MCKHRKQFSSYKAMKANHSAVEIDGEGGCSGGGAHLYLCMLGYTHAHTYPLAHWRKIAPWY